METEKDCLTIEWLDIRNKSIYHGCIISGILTLIIVIIWYLIYKMKKKTSAETILKWVTIILCVVLIIISIGTMYTTWDYYCQCYKG